MAKIDWIPSQRHQVGKTSHHHHNQSDRTRDPNLGRDTLIHPVLSIYQLKPRARHSPSEPLYPFWWGHEEFQSPTSRMKMKQSNSLQKDYSSIRGQRDSETGMASQSTLHRHDYSKVRPAAGKATTRDGTSFEPVPHLPFPKKMIDEMIQTDPPIIHYKENDLLSFSGKDTHLFTHIHAMRNQQCQTSPTLPHEAEPGSRSPQNSNNKQDTLHPHTIASDLTQSAYISAPVQRTRVERPTSPVTLWIPLHEHEQQTTSSPPKRISHRFAQERKTREDSRPPSSPAAVLGDVSIADHVSNTSTRAKSITRPASKSSFRTSIRSQTGVSHIPTSRNIKSSSQNEAIESKQPAQVIDTKKLAAPASLDPIPPQFDAPHSTLGIFEIITKFLDSDVIDCLDTTYSEHAEIGTENIPV